jgi:hypothetical protein
MGTSSENNPSSQQPILNNREADEISSMRAEAQRLSTFSSWRHNDKVEARKIAKAGFFHTGNDSEVKCLWCGTVLNQWDYGDQVMARHRSANPDCPFIRNISDNVPLLNEQQITSQSESEDNNGKTLALGCSSTTCRRSFAHFFPSPASHLNNGQLMLPS